MEKRPLSRDFRLKKSSLLKMSTKCFIVTQKLKENEDPRNPSLYAFSFSRHIHMPVKRETRKELLPNKNHMCETCFKL